MSSFLVVAALSAMLQTPAPAAAPAEEPSQHLLAAAVVHMNAQRLDSAALLLRRVADAPTRLVDDRVRALIMLSVVEFFRSGEPASALALRQALTLAPDLQAPALERNYPDVARILATERATLAAAKPPAVSPAAADSSEPAPPPRLLAEATDSAAPQLLDCLSRCTPGGRPPYFIQFPDMVFSDASAGIGVYERRLRSFLTFQGVIGADGRIEPETVQMTGGAARGMEAEMRRGLAQARFEPGRLNGVPIRTRVTIRFDFESEGTSMLKYSYKVTAR